MIHRFKDEITALIQSPIDEVYDIDPKVAGVINAFRNKTLEIKAGGGGKYGEIVLPKNNLDNYL